MGTARATIALMASAQLSLRPLSMQSHTMTRTRALFTEGHPNAHLRAIRMGTARATIALMASAQLSFPYPTPLIYFCLIWLYTRPTLKTVLRNTVHTSKQAHYG